MKTYADSFGLQWNRFRRTQLDRFSGTSVSRDRFVAATNWPPSLEGESVLEAGSGAGRFTEVLLATGAQVFTFDLSTAVYANLGNNGPHPRLHLLRADIYRIPFPPGTFGRVLCLGVLQHCPDVEGAFRSLARQLRPGGELVFDVYDAEVRRPESHPWYRWRRLLRRMPRPLLFWLVRVLVPLFLPLKRWLSRARLPYAGLLHHWLPILDYEGVFALDQRQLLEWSILDTFDLLAPAYDQPQHVAEVASWLDREGLEVLHLKKGQNGIIARVRKPVVADRAPSVDSAAAP